MKIHEYQAKEIFTQFGLPVSLGQIATNADEAVSAAQKIGGSRWVVKAQVHSGGRGKAGGIKLCKTLDEVRQAADKLIGSQLATHQTAGQGLPINSVYIEQPADIEQELYLSALIDRANKRITFIGSAVGGMDIEEVAQTTPEKIMQVPVHPAAGLQAYQARQLGFFLGLDKKQVAEFSQIMRRIYDLFMQCDASLVEINPLVVTKQGNLVALDAKLNLDDNALFRHKKLQALRDTTQEDEREVYADEIGLSYIPLDGNIGCMVNGAGLAMGTMDMVKLYGGEPANFLDVGGGTTAERVTQAFKLISASDNVKAILVNIFGGIVRCDLIAKGIIEAVQQAGLKIPLVVRLEGTNAKKGRQMLAESGLELIATEGLVEATEKVVAVVNQSK